MDKEDVAYVYNGILLSHQKKAMMPLVVTWMDLSEVSQTKADIMIQTTCVIQKTAQMNLFANRNRLTEIENKLRVTEGDSGGNVMRKG